MFKILATVFLLLSVSYAKQNVIDYMSIGIADQKIDNRKFNHGTSLIVNVGKNNLINRMGMEVEGSIQIDKPEATINGFTDSLKFWSMGMYGTYLWSFDNITIKPRVGILYESIKSSFNKSNSNINTPIDKNKVSLSGGIGISYKITNSTKIYTNYTKLETDIDHITFGAEFKF